MCWHFRILGLAIPALALAMLAPVAAAGWVRVGGNANVVVYADPAAITRKVNFARMRNLLDFAAPQSDRSIGKQPYLSLREEREYDCGNERYRLLRYSLRAGPMFTGAAVPAKSDDGVWLPMMPASLGEALYKTACAKK